MEIEKDPNAILDYLWNWGGWLADGETIASADVLPVGVALAAGKPAPAIVAGSSAAGAVANGAVLAWLSGGVVDADASATCRVTTSAGRVDDRTITFTIVER